MYRVWWVPWWLTWYLCLYICEKCEMSRLWWTHGRTDGQWESRAVFSSSWIRKTTGCDSHVATNITSAIRHDVDHFEKLRFTSYSSQNDIKSILKLHTHTHDARRSHDQRQTRTKCMTWHFRQTLFNFYKSKYFADIDSSHMWQKSSDIRAFRMYTKYVYL